MFYSENVTNARICKFQHIKNYVIQCNKNGKWPFHKYLANAQYFVSYSQYQYYPPLNSARWQSDNFDTLEEEETASIMYSSC